MYIYVYWIILMFCLRLLYIAESKPLRNGDPVGKTLESHNPAVVKRKEREPLRGDD